jgi:hypothetical protein
MKYDLVGYLLGALDMAEQQDVEDALQDDRQLRRQLEVLAFRLQPLEACRHVEPPAGLSDRTCQAVAESQGLVSLAAQDAFSGRDAPSGRRNWTLVDTLFSSGLILVLAMLLFPAILNSRYMADLRSCQDNLRQIGSAMRQYSDLNHGYFPVIPGKGKLSVAGSYAPILVSSGYMDGRQMVYCPAVQNTNNWVSVEPLTEDLLADSAGQAEAESPRQLYGDYGYNPGHMRDGDYHPHRNLQRGYFPVVADVAGSTGSQRASANHAGFGQNVLFEDGSVRFLRNPQTSTNDLLYLSERGRMELGRNPEDSVILEGNMKVPPVVLVGRGR